MNRLVKFKWIIIVALVVFVLAGWRFFTAIPQVETVQAKKQTVVDLVISSGKIRSARQSELGTDSSGVVTRVWVREGDTVANGQRLLELDTLDARQGVEQAQLALETARRELFRLKRGPQTEEINRARSELSKTQTSRKQAELDFTRMQKLYDEKIVPRVDWERSRTAFDQAMASERSLADSLEMLLRQPLPEDLAVGEARLREKEAGVRLAGRELQKRIIIAPFKGLLVRRNVEPGQSATPGTPLVTLADLDQLEIYVETDENNLSKLRVGQKAQVISPAFRDRPFPARLYRIGPEVDSARGVIALRFTLDSLPEFIRPDLTVDVNVEVARYLDANTLPTTTLLEENGRSYLYLVRDGRAKQQEVRVLAKGSQWVAVKDIDLQSVVVLRGTEVKNGQRIRPHKNH